MLRLLGTARDTAVAAALGISVSAVNLKRRLLGIPPSQPLPIRSIPYRWTPETERLVGSMPDIELSPELGISRYTVKLERLRRGITFGNTLSVHVEWTASMLELLGSAPDDEVAARLGISRSATSGKRRSLGISRPKPGQPEFLWTRKTKRRLGKVPDRVLARELGIHRHVVRLERLRLGIVLTRGRPATLWTKPMLKLLGTAGSNREVADRLALGLRTVIRKRTELRSSSRRDL